MLAVRMIGGSTFPTVEGEDFAVVVGAAVVEDEESFLSELQPARAMPATARTATPATTRRFFNDFSMFVRQMCLGRM
jgi:hypothetical protein